MDNRTLWLGTVASSGLIELVADECGEVAAPAPRPHRLFPGRLAAAARTLVGAFAFVAGAIAVLWLIGERGRLMLPSTRAALRESLRGGDGSGANGSGDRDTTVNCPPSYRRAFGLSMPSLL